MKKAIILLILISVFSQTKSQDKKSSWMDSFQKSIVSIGIIDTLMINNHEIPYYKVIGTGSIFYIKVDTSTLPLIVTARHVFFNPNENWVPSRVRIRFSWFDDKPLDKYFGIELFLRNDDGNRLWIEHPNANVDLACIPFYFPEGTQIGTQTILELPYSMIGSDVDVFAGESVLTFGYPSAVGLNFSTKALVRKGIVAWAPTSFKEDSRI